MTLAMNKQELIFTPIVISNVINRVKEKAVDIYERY